MANYFKRPNIVSETAINTMHSSWYMVPASTLVEALLWLLFLGGIVYGFFGHYGSWVKLVFYLFVHGSGLLLIVLSLRYLKYTKIYAKTNRAYWLLFPMLIICFFSTVIGFMLGGKIYLAVDAGVLPFAGASLILLAHQKDIRERIVVVLRRQLICAILFSLYVLYQGRGIEFHRVVWVKEMYEGVAVSFLYAVPFFVGLLVKERDWWKMGTTVVGLLLCAIIAVRGAMRSYSLVVFVATPVAFLIMNFRHKIKEKRRRFWVKVGCLTIILLGLSSYVISTWKLDAYWSTLMLHSTGYREWQDTALMKAGIQEVLKRQMEERRGSETRDFLSTMDGLEYLTGKGFGTTYYSRFHGMEWGMVHFGPVNLIFRGGIPLLVTFMLILGSALLSSWRNSRTSSIAAGCFVFLTAYLVRFITHGAFTSGLGMYVTWLIIGLAFYTDIEARQMKLKRQG